MFRKNSSKGFPSKFSKGLNTVKNVAVVTILVFFCFRFFFAYQLIMVYIGSKAPENIPKGFRVIERNSNTYKGKQFHQRNA